MQKRNSVHCLIAILTVSVGGCGQDDSITNGNHLPLGSSSTDKYAYTEMIKDTSFNDMAEWESFGEILKTNDGIQVTSENFVRQQIKIEPKSNYLLTIRAKCVDTETMGRRQINWLDKDSKFISSYLNVFKCNRKFKQHSNEIAPPEGTAYGVVYVASHEVDPVLFGSVSLKEYQFQK